MTNREYAEKRVEKIMSGELHARKKLPQGKYIPDTNEMYIITKEGQVYSKYCHKFIGGHIHSLGYLKVTIIINGVKRSRYIHRLVAEAYLKRGDKTEVNHKDGNKTNNCVHNLEWVTKKENVKHAWDNGLQVMTEARRLASSANGKKCSKKVGQYTKDDELITVFISQMEASKATGVGQGSISDCCRGKQKTSGGFIWKYVD